MSKQDPYVYAGVEILVTPQQQRVLQLIERRLRGDVPAVQRDLAESLGIRRDSLNKLLARTRRVLAARGLELVMPPRSRPEATPLLAFSESAFH